MSRVVVRGGGDGVGKLRQVSAVCDDMSVRHRRDCAEDGKGLRGSINGDVGATKSVHHVTDCPEQVRLGTDVLFVWDSTVQGHDVRARRCTCREMRLMGRLGLNMGVLGAG